jgi:ABC-type multidrug transport system fused ATPase/permease subunit
VFPFRFRPVLPNIARSTSGPRTIITHHLQPLPFAFAVPSRRPLSTLSTESLLRDCYVTHPHHHHRSVPPLPRARPARTPPPPTSTFTSSSKTQNEDEPDDDKQSCASCRTHFLARLLQVRSPPVLTLDSPPASSARSLDTSEQSLSTSSSDRSTPPNHKLSVFTVDGALDFVPNETLPVHSCFPSTLSLPLPTMYSAPLAGLSGYSKFHTSGGGSFHGSHHNAPQPNGSFYGSGSTSSSPYSGGVALAWENINVYKPLPIYDQLTARLNAQAEDGQLILKQLNGVIHFGQMFAIMGPSGAGKSTLLKCLFGTANVKHDGKMYVQNKQVRSVDFVHFCFNL